MTKAEEIFSEAEQREKTVSARKRGSNFDPPNVGNKQNCNCLPMS